MGEAGLSIAIKSAANTAALTRPFDLRAIPPTLIKREAAPRRTKIWEFNTNLHCSIIGTCLSGTELRQVLKKAGMTAQGCTDHELHGIAVTLAGRHDDAARHLHKALDHRHKLAISQFAKADTEDGSAHDVARRGAARRYPRRLLGHADASADRTRRSSARPSARCICCRTWSESANRADIRRLCVLEAEKTALEEKIERQQQALHEAVVGRDNQIRELRQALVQRIVGGAADGMSEDDGALRSLVTDLERRLAAEASRRDSLDERLAAAQAMVGRERSARLEAERERDGDAPGT